MGMLDDVAIFTTVIQQGGFSHAARYLGLSNGLISRRIAQLEKNLNLTLIKRTTRQLELTAEGELLLQHGLRIQQELEQSVTLLQALAHKPKGTISVSAPVYFGRHYLTPIITEFLNNFPDITINLFLSNQQVDPIKEKFDLLIRGAGYQQSTQLKDSSMQMKLLVKEGIGLYASPEYLVKNPEPSSPKLLERHTIISCSTNATAAIEDEVWSYQVKNKQQKITVTPKLNCNDIESCIIACSNGYGIGKFTELNARHAVQKQKLRRILTQYDWGDYNLYVIYPLQKALPQRTRLLLDFIYAHMKF